MQRNGYTGSIATKTRPTAISPARLTAYSILERVRDGAYASDLLLAHCTALSSRDAGLASELVLGTLRVQNQLDFLIGHFSGKPNGKLDPEVRLILQLGVYQLRYLERIPTHAAVSESVNLVYHARKRSAAGFVNAVLRKVHRDAVAWPDRSVALAHPAWLLAKWDQQYGPETTERIAKANLLPPATYVRLGDRPAPAGVTLQPTDVAGAFELIDGEAPDLRIQDVGSQSIVPLLNLAPGQRFLDLCASPGNKTAQALETPGLRAVACDVHAARAKTLRRLGCPVVQLDGTRPLPFSSTFDRILVDAPCSGTGTLSRNPEIKWRITRSDLDDLQSRQIRLLTNALARLAPGGRLVYSTCSLEAEENQVVVDRVLAKCEGRFEVKQSQIRLPGCQPGDGFFASVIDFT